MTVGQKDEILTFDSFLVMLGVFSYYEHEILSLYRLIPKISKFATQHAEGVEAGFEEKVEYKKNISKNSKNNNFQILKNVISLIFDFLFRSCHSICKLTPRLTFKP